MPAGQPTVEIYALTEPDSGEIRYVGKAVCALQRFKSHLRDARRRNTPVYRWIRALLSDGTVPCLVVLEICEAERWKEREINVIEDYRTKYPRLLNVAFGGDEPFCSTEVRVINARKVVILRTNTPEKAETYRLKRTLGQLLKNGYCNEETKAKMRLAAHLRPEVFGAWAAI